MNIKVIVVVISAISFIIGSSLGYVISSSTISEMQSEISTLQKRYQDLNSTYQDYVATHSYSNSEYNSLNETYCALYRDYQQLQAWLDGNLSLINSLNSQITSLQSQIDSLNIQIQTLASQNNKLQTWLDGNETLLNQTQIWLQGNITYYESQIEALNQELKSLNETYQKLLIDYQTLVNAGIVFDGLKISDLKIEKGYYWDLVLGNVTNVSNKSMSKVYVILFTFNLDGSLDYYYTWTIENLAVNETKNFEFSFVLEENQTFKVFAVGSYGFSDVENSKIAELLAEIEQLNARIEELEGMVTYEVYVLTDQDYYHSVMDSLQKANSSVLVVMYSMIYDPDDTFDWANDLIRELVNAKNRGVNVTVIIEYRTYFGYMENNLEAYNYLSSNGVNVKLDNETDTDHLKLVIIDNRIVFVGSHNWSESALYYNHETSVKIVSEEIAQELSQYVENNYG